MPTTPKPTNPRLLKEGLQGDDVKYLQESLNELGFDVGSAGADGIFGPDTKSAVIAFQTAKGIGIDGLVGPETWGTLDTALQAAGGSDSGTGSGSNSGSGSGGTPVVVPGAGDPPDIGTPPEVTDPDGDGTTVAVPVVVDPTPAAFEYQIVWGDTLGSIAQRFDTTVQAIVDANASITDPNKIREGQFIVVPPNPYTAPTSNPNYNPEARLDDESVVWVAIDFDTQAEAQAVRSAVAAGGYVGLVPEEADLLGITMRQTERLTDDISIELTEIEALTGLSSGLGLPIADIGQVMRRAGLFVQQSAALAGGYQITNVAYAGAPPLGSPATGGPTGSPGSPPGGSVNQPQLQAGSRGPTVGLLQEALALLGLSPGRADQIFGPITDDRVRQFQTREGLVADGIVGVLTWGAIRQGLVNQGSAGAQALIRQIDAGSGALGGTSTSSGGSGGYRPATLRLGAMDPNGLLSSSKVNPELAQRVAAVLRDLAAAGYRPKVQEGYRTFERQQMLYNQGRTTPGNRVTGAGPGRSFHNYGLAVDIVMQGRTPYLDNSPFWDALGEAAARHGLTWGGNWRNPDRPHVEFHPGLTASQAGTLLDEYRSGGLEEVWASLGLAGNGGVTQPTGGTRVGSTFNPNETLYLSDLTEYLQQNSRAYRERMAQIATSGVGLGGLNIREIALAEAARLVRTGVATLPPGTIANIDGDTWVYVVNNGDFLSSIAAAFGMTAAQLARANGIDPDRIAVGQLIIITDPPKRPTGQGPADYTNLGIAEFTDPSVLLPPIDRIDAVWRDLDRRYDTSLGEDPAIERLERQLDELIGAVTDTLTQHILMERLVRDGWAAEDAQAMATVWDRRNLLLSDPLSRTELIRLALSAADEFARASVNNNLTAAANITFDVIVMRADWSDATGPDFETGFLPTLAVDLSKATDGAYGAIDPYNHSLHNFAQLRRDLWEASHHPLVQGDPNARFQLSLAIQILEVRNYYRTVRTNPSSAVTPPSDRLDAILRAFVTDELQYPTVGAGSAAAQVLWGEARRFILDLISDNADTLRRGLDPYHQLPAASRTLVAEYRDREANPTAIDGNRRRQILESLASAHGTTSQQLLSLIAQGLDIAQATLLGSAWGDVRALSTRYEQLKRILVTDEAGNPRLNPDWVLAGESGRFERALVEYQLIQQRVLVLTSGGVDPLLKELTPTQEDALDLLLNNFTLLAAFAEAFDYRTSTGVGTTQIGRQGVLHWSTVNLLANASNWQTLLRDEAITIGRTNEYRIEEYYGFRSWEHASNEFEALTGRVLDRDLRSQLSEAALAVQKSPHAWNLLVGIGGGSSLLTEAEPDGSDPGRFSLVKIDDVNTWLSYRGLRPLTVPKAGEIDIASDGGERDYNYTDDDFIAWIEANDDLELAVQEFLISAVRSGLVDKGGWDLLKDLAGWAGILFSAGLLIVGTGGLAGNLLLIGAIGAGVLETTAALATDDPVGAVLAGLGVFFDALDAATLATKGITGALASSRNVTNAGEVIQLLGASGSLPSAIDGALGLVVAAIKGLGSSGRLPKVILDQLPATSRAVRVHAETTSQTGRAIALASGYDEMVRLLRQAGLDYANADVLVRAAMLKALESGGLPPSVWEVTLKYFADNGQSADLNALVRAVDRGWFDTAASRGLLNIFDGNLDTAHANFIALVRASGKNFDDPTLTFAEMRMLYLSSKRGTVLNRAQLLERFNDGWRWDPVGQNWINDGTQRARIEADVALLRTKVVEAEEARRNATRGEGAARDRDLRLAEARVEFALAQLNELDALLALQRGDASRIAEATNRLRAAEDELVNAERAVQGGRTSEEIADRTLDGPNIPAGGVIDPDFSDLVAAQIRDAHNRIATTTTESVATEFTLNGVPTSLDHRITDAVDSEGRIVKRTVQVEGNTVTFHLDQQGNVYAVESVETGNLPAPRTRTSAERQAQAEGREGGIDDLDSDGTHLADRRTLGPWAWAPNTPAALSQVNRNALLAIENEMARWRNLHGIELRRQMEIVGGDDGIQTIRLTYQVFDVRGAEPIELIPNGGGGDYLFNDYGEAYDAATQARVQAAYEAFINAHPEVVPTGG